MLVRGKRFYQLDNYLPVEPSKVEKNGGRPKTKRRREEIEPMTKNSGTKLSKKGKPGTCSLFKQQGHNKAGCEKNKNQSEGGNTRTKLSQPRNASQTNRKFSPCSVSNWTIKPTSMLRRTIMYCKINKFKAKTF